LKYYQKEVRKIISVSIRLSSDFSCQQDSIISSLPFGEIEKSRLSSIKNPTYKSQSLATLVALNDILPTSASDLTILRTSNNKPYFNQSILKFSLSHAGKLSVAVLGDIPVGIDIELLDKSKDTSKLISRFFNDEEKEVLQNSSDTALTFYSMWTKKEALSKISGEGLSSVSKQNSISGFSRQYVLNLQNETYIMSVCAAKSDTVTINNAFKELTIYEL